MATFCTIFQLKCKTNDIFFPDGDNHKFWKSVYKRDPPRSPYEIHYTDKLQDNTRFMCYYMMNMMHFQMRERPNTLNYARAKLESLNYVLEHVFFTPNQKQHIFKAFSKTQKHYFALNRFARVYKCKKAIVKIDTDLGLNKINARKSNMIIIYQNDVKYMFIIQDLINIIETCLTNDNAFFAEPLPIKNPYNNIKFSAAILYNIYFFVKERNFIMPTLLHLFFLSNFNLLHFTIENEAYLRDLSIKKYIQNVPASMLHAKALTILLTNRYTSRLRICEDFPKNELVDIMRPYLYLYFIGEYSLQTDKRHKYQVYMEDRLKQLYFFNPQFGRKYIDTTTNVNKFNTAHPVLTIPSVDAHFRKSVRACELFSWVFRPASSAPQLNANRDGLLPPAQHVRTVVVPRPLNLNEIDYDSDSSDSSSRSRTSIASSTSSRSRSSIGNNSRDDYNNELLHVSSRLRTVDLQPSNPNWADHNSDSDEEVGSHDGSTIVDSEESSVS